MNRILRKLPVIVLITLLSCSAHPPKEKGTFLKADLVELVKLDPSLHLDIRYATANNFLGRPVYTEARAFLQRPAAESLIRANQKLHEQGYGLLIFDGYRPWAVTKIFWDATPADKKIFVANPKEGSRHNRGCAVDLSMFDLKTGKEVEMTGAYDEMTDRSSIKYTGGTEDQRKRRDLLRSAMESEGFAVYEPEWWHYDYKDWQKYPILNIPFSDIHTVQ
jgi:D-alanyl-D-alanine dipeptidase